MKEGVGDIFQRETLYSRGGMYGGSPGRTGQPDPYKRGSQAPVITLASPETSGGGPIWDIIRKRRSVRRFGGPPLSEVELSQLLWASQGITARQGRFGFRAAPSAGALYPVETYILINRVMGIEPGVYHYVIGRHALEQLKKGDFGQAAAGAALGQDMLEKADIVFIWSAVFERARSKYKQRAYRYIYMDAGHIAQNTALAAVALGLGSCQIAAFYDDEFNQLLGLDGNNESVIYLTAVGRI